MPLAAADTLDLDVLNPLFEASAPHKVVEWAAAQFGDGLLMSSSFGAESAMLLHMATRVRPDVRVVFVDTCYLFPETFAHLEALRERLGLNVLTYRTRNDPAAYLARAGEVDPDWRRDVNACCGENKNEPFDRAMAELRPRAWLRGIRRSQAATRVGRQFVEWSDRYNCYAVSPLLNMTSRDIYAYMKANDLPYHPLYASGYLSIGCRPQSCTRPVTPGDDARSGRWADAGKVECGINMDVPPGASR